MTRQELNEIIEYLESMNNECRDETGWDMSSNDVIGHLSSNEFIDRFVTE